MSTSEPRDLGGDLAGDLTGGIAGAIAIVGMAGRFPGARDLEQFWRNLRAGVESIRRLGGDELAALGLPAELAADGDFVPAVALPDGIDELDAPFFGISHREAEIMDPQHRLFLECCWQALENAGYVPESCPGEVGVFGGATASTYVLFNLAASGAADLDPLAVMVGNAADSLTTRVSYKLDLRGPSHAVQCACSTSLVAVHLACESLLAERCDMALAGAVSINVAQRGGYRWRADSILARDGHCRAFDADAQGTVFGGGVGVVALRRLADALAAGDRVRAVILGSAINNDGAGKAGFSAPSVEGEARAIVEALAVAGVPAESVSYVEAHGTGTALGDPVEMQALNRAFRAETRKKGFCALGTVKTNIGHLDIAAGIAGLIKTVLALEHREIPPSLHFRRPNPRIDFPASPFYVNSRLADWPRHGGPRRAGVSAFGFGGTNAHLVLEEAPAVRSAATAARPARLLLLSARTEAALDAATRRLADHLASHPELDAGDVAFTLHAGRRVFSHRRMLVCRSLGEAAGDLRAGGSGSPAAPAPAAGEGWRRPASAYDERAPRRQPVAFLFPGEASGHAGMARGLYDGEPVFRAELERVARLFRPHLSRDLVELLYPGPGSPAAGPPDAAAVAAAAWREDGLARAAAVFAVEVALARLWMSWGIEPEALAGQGAGEIAAAHLAGVFGIEDAVALVAARAGGSAPALAALADRLSLSPPGVSLVSGHTGRRLAAGEAASPALWSRLPAAPVTLATPAAPARWAEAVAALCAQEERILIEVGPGRALTAAAMAGEVAGRMPNGGLAIASLPDAGEGEGGGTWGDCEHLLHGLGRLWLAGHELDAGRLYAGQGCRRVPLPTYPFERRRYWIEARRPAAGGGAGAFPTAFSGAAAAAHPALAEGAGQAPGAPGEVGPGNGAKAASAGWASAGSANAGSANAGSANAGWAGAAGEERRFHPRPPLPTRFVAPSGAAQEAVAAIWRDVLGLREVGAHDSFLDLGGDSLLAARLMASLRAAFATEVSIESFFTRPTIAAVAAAVAAGTGPSSKPAPRAPRQPAGASDPGAGRDVAAGGDLAAQKPAATAVLPDSDLAREPVLPGLAVAAREPAPALPNLAAREPALLDPIPAQPRGSRGGGGEFPLSFAQERLWFLDRLEPGSSAYTMATAVEARGPLDVAAFGAALGEVVRRHEVLRTVYATRRSGPVQVVGPAAAADEGMGLTVADLTRLAAGARRAEAERLTGAEEARPFDLARGPLLRVAVLLLAPAQSRILLTLHHIAGDGWSFGILVRELGALYAAARARTRAPLAPLGIQYADFAVWQRARLTGERLAREVAFWRESLAGAEPLRLPADRPRPAVQSFRGRHLLVRLDAGPVAALAVLCRRQGATLFMGLLAAFQTLLGRQAGTDDLVVGTPVAGRHRRQLEGLIGLFLNSVALRGDLAADPAFAELLGRTRKRALAAFDHQELPFEKLVEELAPERSLAHSPIYQVMLVQQNARGGRLRLGDIELEVADLPGTSAKLDLTLSFLETGDGLLLRWMHNRDLFDAATVTRLAGRFATLVGGAAAAPERRLSELPLLSAAETQQLREWNDTAAAYGDPGEVCLHELIWAQAARTPERIAVVDGDRHLRYGELMRAAAALAGRLRALGVGPETVVGVAAERSLELIAGLLGVLAAGAAYLPLDPDYPADRLAFMLADSGAEVVIGQRRHLERLPLPDAGAAEERRSAVEIVTLDGLLDGLAGPGAGWAAPRAPARAGAGAPPKSGAVAGNLAYVLYTSGSTGRPKAAMNSHRGIVNRLLWMQQAFGLGEPDRVLQKTPYGFDVSVWELFWPLLAGARLVMARPGGHQDSAYLVETVIREGVTTLHFVPSMLQVFVAAPGVERCRSLRRVVASGEALPADLAERWQERLAVPLFNLYGPTEAAVDVTWWRCSPAGGGLPIGRPVANTRIEIAERLAGAEPGGDPWIATSAARAGIGVPGELLIGGVQVGRGYRGRPELTAERFVPDPWHGGRPGERLYRTGDLARYRADGAIEYLGRIDHQVKVRGQRIELGEIEAAVASHPAVREAVVVARREGHAEGTVGAVNLVAYATRWGDGEVDLAGLRGHLARTLPESMLPSALVVLERLPLSANGKLDRRALPAPERGPAAGVAERIAPRNDLERFLAGLWREVLAGTEPGVHDSFFDLGGNSITGALFVNRLQEELGEIVHVVTLFDAPTLDKLAAHLAAEYPDAIARRLGAAAAATLLGPAAAAVTRSGEGAAGPRPAAGGAPAADGSHGPVRAPAADSSHAPVHASAAASIRGLVGASAVESGEGLVGAPAARSGGDLAGAPAAGNGGGPVDASAAESGGNLVGSPAAGNGGRAGFVSAATGNGDGLGEAELAAVAARVHRLAPDGPPLARPVVFILSPPRSGSTLLRVMLAGHARLFAPPELELLGFRTLAERAAAFAGRDAFRLEGTIRAVMEARRVGVEQARQLLAGWETEGRGTRDLYAAIQEWIGDRILVDKTPTYAWDSATLRRAESEFAAPRYVHLTRHPYGMIRSFEEARIDQIFAPGEDRFSRRQLAELLWVLAHRNAVEFLAGVPAGRQHWLRFEDLLRDPPAELARLCAFLGLDYEPAMADPYRQGEGSARMTDGLHAASRMIGDVKFHRHGRVAREVAEQWREWLGGADFLGDMARETAARLGYEIPRQARAMARIPRLEASTGTPLPLSFAQERLWFLDRLDPGRPTYNMPVALRLRGRLEPAALAAALALVMRRHEVLRTTYAESAAGPVQTVAPWKPGAIVLPLADLTGLPAARRQEEVRRQVAAVAGSPFDLAAGPVLRALLLRVGPEDHAAAMAVHHIAGDGWSMGVLIRELGRLYQAAREGRPATLPEPPIQYSDFAVWQRRHLAGERLAAQLAWWRQRLSGLGPLALPTDHPRPPAQRYRGAHRRLAVEAEAVAAIAALGKQLGTTLFMTFLAGLLAVLARHAGQSDLAVGTPEAGRSRRELEGLIGLLVNTLVIRTEVPGEISFAALAGRVRQAALGAFAHQEVPFEKIVEELRPERDLSRSPLFQVLFVLQNALLEPVVLPGLTLTVEPFDTGAAKFDLTVMLAESGGRLLGTLEYDRDLFDAATVDRLGGHLQAVLAAAARAPARRLAELPMLAGAELSQLLVEWNDTAVPRPEDLCLHQLFERQAARAPERLAVADASAALNYAELERRANRLAWQLAAMGVGPESRVGVLVERSVEMVVALLGVLKAGGAYVPLDPAHPRERLGMVLADSGVAVLLSEEPLLACLGGVGADSSGGLGGAAGASGPDERLRLLLLDRDRRAIAARPERPPAVTALPDSLAYVLYTSGSTGRPKGVQVSHRAVVNLLLAMAERPGLGPEDVVPALTTLAFDISGLEIHLPLAVGARIEVLRREEQTDGALLAARLDESGATLIQATPSTWRLLVEQPGWRGGAPAGRGEARPGKLGKPERKLRALCGGEALPRELAEALLARGIELWNVYGPTETAIWSSAGRVMAAGSGSAAVEPAGHAPVPLGPPIANTRFYVVDAGGELVPRGAAGELLIGGAGVARGYLGRPELTAERFVPDRWGGRGERAYRTGDLVRHRPSGELDFLGRIDHQVKVRGHRIELGEIEAALATHPLVAEAVVVARGDGAGRQLTAYVVPREGGGDLRRVSASPRGEPTELAPAALREHLRRSLPEYMVPALLFTLAALPRTPNGKLDRRALPAPETLAAGIRTARVAPRGEIEEALAAIWTEILGRPSIGAADNFFDLGGHSLAATLVITRLRDRFGVEIPVSRLFANPTLAALGREVAAALGRLAPAGPVEEAASPGERGAAVADGAPGAPDQTIDAGKGASERATGEDTSAAGQEVGAAGPGAAAAGEREMVLSFAQERLWFLDRLDPGKPTYNIAMALRLSGRLDVPALHAALLEVVRRHETLRTTFDEGGSRPVQRIAPSGRATLGWGLADLSHLPAARREAERRQRTDLEARRPFDLRRGPLLRALLLRLTPADRGDQGEHLALLTLHHIVADGWSLALLVRELVRYYLAAREGRPAELPELRFHYGDFAVRQRQELAGARLVAEVGYWVERLAGVPPLELPADRPRPPVQRFRGGRRRFVVEPPLAAAVAGLGSRLGTTLFMTSNAVFLALLSRHSGQTDLAVGIPHAGRTRQEIEGLIGLFVNTLVLRFRLSDGDSFAALAGQVRAMALDAYAHHETPFEKIVEELRPERDLSRSPLFQVLFNLQVAPLEAVSLPGLTVAPEPLDTGATKFDLSLALAEREGRLSGVLEYDRDLFEAATVDRLGRHFVALLAAAAQEPSRRLCELPLLGEAELSQLLVEWNDTAAPRPAGLCLHQLFERQAARTPERLAVTDESAALDYAELERRANRLAWHLLAMGVGPESRVGVLVERSVEMVVALLAVLKAGGAYVPLDPTHPQERLALVLADSGVSVLVSEEPLLASLGDFRIPGGPAVLGSAAGRGGVLGVTGGSSGAAGFGGAAGASGPDGRLPIEARLLLLDRERRAIAARPERPPAVTALPESLAYVLYTSGSTGRPKGVQLPHRAVVNFVLAMAERPGLGPEDVVPALTTLAFDISGLEIYLPLAVGARVAVLRREDAADGARLAARLAECGATLVQATPASWRLLLEQPGWPGGAAGGRAAAAGGGAVAAPVGRPGEPRGGRWRALCGGEALPRELAEALLARGVELWNVYGPTETAIWSSARRVASAGGANAPEGGVGSPAQLGPVGPTARLGPLGPGAEAGTSVLLGPPIANTRFHVVDRAGELAPQGAAGELWIGGAGVARGYLGRPDLTAERFVPDRWGESGARAYRTGDLVRHRQFGELDFLGRIDHQVKVRGHRIELGEIEAALATHPGVAQAVVTARGDGAERQLVAYLVPRLGAALAGAGEARSAVAGHLQGPAAGPAAPSAAAIVPAAGGLAPAELREHLQRRLPEYMVPSLMVTLAALPLTASGKVDRRALPAPESLAAAPSAAGRPPDGEIEVALAAIWAEVLGRQAVGADDNFFELGGHSLLATLVISRVRAALDVELSMQRFFSAPTVAGQAREVAAARGLAGDAAEIAAAAAGDAASTVAGPTTATATATAAAAAQTAGLDAVAGTASMDAGPMMRSAGPVAPAPAGRAGEPRVAAIAAPAPAAGISPAAAPVVGSALAAGFAPAVAGSAPAAASAAAGLDAASSPVARLAAAVIPRADRGGRLPLSFSQERLWFLQQLQPDSAAFNVGGATQLTGRLDLAALARAVAELVRRHEALRTTFALAEGEPVQVVQPPLPLPLPLVDLAMLGVARRSVEARRLATLELGRPFDLGSGPLLRTTLLRSSLPRAGAPEHILLLTVHHVAADGWSFGILLRDLAVLYSAFAAGQASPLPPLPIQYADFAVWQRQALSGERLERDLDYWRRQLAGMPVAPLLPGDRDRRRSTAQGVALAAVERSLPADLTAGLRALSQRHFVSLYMTLLAAWHTLLLRAGGERDQLIGAPIANRNLVETEGLIGVFLNTLMLRTDLAGAADFTQLLAAVRDTCLGAFSHQDLPLETVLRAAAPEREALRGSPFQVMFLLQNLPQRELAVPGLTFAPWGGEVAGADLGADLFELGLTIHETAGGGLAASITFNSRSFDAASLLRLLERYECLLAGVIADSGRDLWSYGLLTAGQESQLLQAAWGAPAAYLAGGPPDLVHRAIAARAAAAPAAVAVATADGRQLTYGQLAAASRRLASDLRALGAGPECVVGVALERSPELVIALLAVLEAGAAYLPLDPSYPDDRLDVILADAGAAALVSSPSLLARLPVLRDRGLPALLVETGGAPWDEGGSKAAVPDPGWGPLAAAAREMLAYVLFTSGSTGRPKGVMVSHGSFARYTASFAAEHGLGPGDRVLQLASIGFDTSAEEIFPTLASGATLVLRDDAMLASMPGLLARCGELGITVLDLPTALWHELASGGRLAGAALPPALRLVVIGGERALPERLGDWLAWTAGAAPVRLWNTYGPTETTIVATRCELSAAALAGAELPIGGPVPGGRAYVLDARLALAPAGFAGELAIGGEGVARGYAGRPDWTAERFLPDPYGGVRGARMFRTGDRVRIGRSGAIEFLGRLDQQVKIRGFRVELSEIEAVLAAHPGVAEAMVAAREEAPGDRRLAAYWVPAASGGPPPTGLELRDHLRRRLPDYMVPAAFVELPALPRTPSGKPDRRGLPAPGRLRPEQSAVYVAPSTPTEEGVARIWEEVLQLDRVGVEDRFFDLGGHSLLIPQVLYRLGAAFNLELPLQIVYSQPTVRELALTIDEILLDEIERLAAEEIRVGDV